MIYDANRTYKVTENHIWRTVNAVLNRVVPDAYKIASTIVMVEQGRN